MRYDSRNRDWAFKRRFDTRKDAVAFNHDPTQRPYVCPDCTFWHLGHLARGVA